MPIPKMDILWMTAGLGCDGDTIAVTEATQPSIEDFVLSSFRGYLKFIFIILSWATKTETSLSRPSQKRISLLL
jgi:hypothetical protein